MLTGGLGNDTIDGGAGDDTAVFSHNFNDYTVQDFGARIMVVGPDGTDTLIVDRASAIRRRDDHARRWRMTAIRCSTRCTISAAIADVFQAGVNALDHFNTFGWHEGRDPNAFFDTSGYLAVNPDVAASGMNPLDHYHQTGWQQGRDPSARLRHHALPDPQSGCGGGRHRSARALSRSTAWPKAAQAYEAIGQTSPTASTRSTTCSTIPTWRRPASIRSRTSTPVGWHEGRNPNAWFDTAGYLSHYADVAAAGINPLQHYEPIGWHEGRDPSAEFDTLGYLAANPDVAAARRQSARPLPAVRHL